MRKEDVDALLLGDQEALAAVPCGDSVLAGPAAGAGQVVAARVVKAHLQQREPSDRDLPEAFGSHLRPAKQQTVTLWSKRGFLKRLYTLRSRAAASTKRKEPV